MVGLKRYKDAEVEARKSLELDNKLSRPYSVLGYVHLIKKEYKEAEQYYENAIKTDPNEARH
ncbi:MAG TPA: hypothetical protein DCX53_02075, partial [Anaerolineae bacterium]|nr:hypothetical protein [Anaerolineae bacterium]